MIARRNILTALIGLAAAFTGARRGEAAQLTDDMRVQLNDGVPYPEISEAAEDTFVVASIDSGGYYKLRQGRWKRYGYAGWVGPSPEPAYTHWRTKITGA